MNNYPKIIATAIILGLLTGGLASSLHNIDTKNDTKTECEKTEEVIKNQSNLNGAIACFPPGIIDVNVSQDVQKGSNLECVCRRSYMGNVQLWTINRAN